MLLFSTFLVSLFALAWYRFNWVAVLQHLREASSGEVALQYGFRAPVFEKAAVWTKFAKSGFLDPYLPWILALMAIAALLGNRKRWTIVLLCIVQIGLVIFAFSLNDAVETRYLEPLAPYFAIGAAMLCAAARYSWIRIAVLGLCLIQWGAVNRASFEPKVVYSPQFPWLLPIVPDGARREAVMDVVRLTSIAPGYNIVGVEEPWLNANTLAFYAASNRLTTGVRSFYTSLGYAQKDLDAALKRIEEFKAPFFITLDESFQGEPNFLNIVSLPVLRELKAGSHYSQRAFPDKYGIVIFQRSDAKQ